MIKNLIILVIACLFTQNLSGQFTFTADDLPLPGDRLALRINNSTQTFTQANAGPNQTWDFSSSAAQIIEQLSYVNPTGQAGNDLFPESNIAATLMGGSSFVYFKATEDTLFTLGTFLGNSGNDDAFTVRYDPYQTEYVFPLGFGSQFNSSSVSELFLGEISPGNDFLLKQNVTTDIEVDGYGTVKTFQGEFNALRIKRTSLSVDSTFLITNNISQFFGATTTTNVTYEWLTQETRGPIVTIELAANTEATIATISVVDTALSSLGVGIEYEAPVASFVSAPLGVGDYVFIDESTGPPEQWFWDFGDGDTSSFAMPRHQFLQEGSFPVCLTVTNRVGENTYCDTIEIDNLIPKAAFNFTLQGQGVVNFENTTSSSGTTSFLWDFGDSTTTNLTSPTHTFSGEGPFTVCLIASNTFGSDTLCQEIIINDSPPETAFSYTAVSGASIQFEDQSTNGVSNWLWDFGDGNSSAEQNPLHSFPGEGDYTVCLVVFNFFGADTLCQQISIGRLRPLVAFAIENTGLGAYQFSDQSTNAPNAWAWDFGDGNQSQEQSPNHQYTQGGSYQVCLITSNDFGADSLCQALVVPDLQPQAGIGFNNQGKGEFQFSDLTTNEPNAWLWDFGDGDTSSLQNPIHSFAAEGNYQVCLQVANAFGVDTTCVMIGVFDLIPVAAFGSTITDSASVVFMDQSSNMPSSWLWDFGDGDTSTLQSPTHAYTSSGIYTVCLIAKNEFGADTLCQMINIVLTDLEIGGVELELRIGPNPVRENLNIQLQGALPAPYLEMRIINTLGHPVWQGRLIQQEEIDTQSWPGGMYWLELRTPEGGQLLKSYPLIKY